MPEKIQGIVLDFIKFKENSFICKIYTKQHGLISIIINGIANKNIGLSTIHLQPLTHIECIVYFKEKKALFKAIDIVILTSTFGLVPDISRNSVSVFISEIVLRTVKEFHSDFQIYSLLERIVVSISDRTLNIGSLHLFFLCSYIEALGFSIEEHFVQTHNVISTSKDELERKLLEIVKMDDYTYIELSKVNKSRLLNSLLIYLGKLTDLSKINSLKILEEIMT